MPMVILKKCCNATKVCHSKLMLFESKFPATQITTENMSHLQYYAYPGKGESAKKNFKYSQAVRVGDRIECAGQGNP